MKYFLETGLGIISAFALISGMRRYPLLDDSSKIVLLIIAAGLLFDLPFCSPQGYDSMVSMNICIAVHFLLVCIYFGHTIDIFIRNNTGLKIGIAGLLLGAGSAGHIYGHYAALTESLCVTAMCLTALYRLLSRHEQLRLMYYHHFWFIILFLFYWSITYFIQNFFTYDLMPAGYTLSAGQSMKLIGLLTYAGTGCVFLLYRKKFTVHE